MKVIFIVFICIFLHKIECFQLRRSSIITHKTNKILNENKNNEYRNNLMKINLLSNTEIETAFNVATFGPQPFWFLMILIPNVKLTRQIMGNWIIPIIFTLIHLFIVIISASQDQGTAPIA